MENKNRVKVEIIESTGTRGNKLDKGDIGYIDGYLPLSPLENTITYGNNENIVAIVVSPTKSVIEYIPLNKLKVI